MTNKLEDMSLEELWQLFPIVLTEHNSQWAEWYCDEVECLKNILPCDVEYHHVGSTAIESIMAKPIVDILIAVDTVGELRYVAEILQGNGYILMSFAKERASLNKGYTENGYAERVFHLHIRLKNDIDEVYFRDYLNSHPNVAHDYETLKLRLSKLYKRNRDAYTSAKTDFVQKYTALAKQNKLNDDIVTTKRQK